MAKFSIFSITDANKAIESAHAAINPQLTAAKISTLEVNGKPVAATSDEVPLQVKISALAAVTKAGAADEQMSQLLASNQLLADQATQLRTENASLTTNVSTLSAEKVTLTNDLTAAKNANATLTAENTNLTQLREGAVKEGARVTGQLNALNSELSKRCLGIGCLSDLRGADNALLPSTATQAEREAAADRVSAADKIVALSGAVNSTLAKCGVDVSKLPSGGAPLLGAIPQSGILAQYAAAKASGSVEGVRFYREHSKEIDAAYRAKQPSK
jgi:hypothetical protein